MADENSWSKSTIVGLAADLHSALRVFVETVQEAGIGFHVGADDPIHDQYESVVHAQWVLHDYLHPEV